MSIQAATRPQTGDTIHIDGVAHLVTDWNMTGVNGDLFDLAPIGKRGKPLKQGRPATWKAGTLRVAGLVRR